MSRLIALFSCALLSAGPLLAEAPKPTLTDVPYGPHPRQVLDFYKAASDQPAPLLVFIHGGGKTRANFSFSCRGTVRAFRTCRGVCK